MRFSIFITVALAASILSGMPAEGSNFSTGALLNSQWICINPNLSTSGPISERKVAELEFAPTTVKKDKSVTTVTFTKFNLKSSNGLFTAVALQVFNTKTTYKRSFIPLKPTDGVQKINFSVKVPTKEIKNIVLNITIQDPKNRKVAGSCIPRSAYTGLLPSQTLVPTATPSPGPTENKNPVVTKIRGMIPNLKFPTETVAPPVEWIATSEIDPGKLQSLKNQHQLLSNAYPDLYRWTKPALAVISNDATWVRTQLETAGCSPNIIEVIKIYETDVTRPAAGTTYCRERLTAFFLVRNTTDQKWSTILGSEFGGVIQENSSKNSPLYRDGGRSWYSSTPRWYSEGSQLIILVIAKTQQTRLWNQESMVYQNIGSYCADDDLVELKCDFILGMAAAELAVALYGWDAPLRLFGKLDPKLTQQEIFQSTFGDSFELFRGWSRAYLQYLANGDPLPLDLTSRLKM
jgi:hypothetical protein